MVSRFSRCSELAFLLSEPLWVWGWHVPHRGTQLQWVCRATRAAAEGRRGPHRRYALWGKLPWHIS